MLCILNSVPNSRCIILHCFSLPSFIALLSTRTSACIWHLNAFCPVLFCITLYSALSLNLNFHQSFGLPCRRFYLRYFLLLTALKCSVALGEFWRRHPYFFLERSLYGSLNAILEISAESWSYYVNCNAMEWSKSGCKEREGGKDVRGWIARSKGSS